MHLCTYLLNGHNFKTGHFSTTNIEILKSTRTLAQGHRFSLSPKSKPSYSASLAFRNVTEAFSFYSLIDQNNNPDHIASKLLPRKDGTASWKTIL